MKKARKVLNLAQSILEEQLQSEGEIDEDSERGKFKKLILKLKKMKTEKMKQNEDEGSDDEDVSSMKKKAKKVASITKKIIKKIVQ